MDADPMNPATAVTWRPFIQAAYEQFVSHPGQVNPATITNMPAGYTLVRTIQMTDFLGPAQSRVFYGFVAVGGAPKTAVVALRGTATKMEWWDDFHWDLVPFTKVPGGGRVARGFCDIYDTFGTMTPGQQHSTPAPATFAADIARAATGNLPAEVDPGGLPIVVTGHSLGRRAGHAAGRGPDREHAAEAAGLDVRRAAGGRRRLRRPLRRPEHRVLADLQPGRRRPVLPRRHRRQLPARHHRVRDQLAGEGEVEPGLRPRAEHLHARAVTRHGAAGPGLQLAARQPPRRRRASVIHHARRRD
jgi:hypothetical protein